MEGRSRFLLNWSESTAGTCGGTGNLPDLIPFVIAPKLFMNRSVQNSVTRGADNLVDGIPADSERDRRVHSVRSDSLVRRGSEAAR